MLGCAVALVLAPWSAPGARAAPVHDHGLTIAVTPNPAIAGEGVLVRGRLLGSQSAGRQILIYRHLAGSGSGFALVGRTTTDSAGDYQFTRPGEGVYGNQSWFARGPAGAHSRTLEERVAPLVSVSPSATSADTDHPIVFRGALVPDHALQRVLLQEQVGSSDDWRTLASGLVRGDSRYVLSHRWRRPGPHTVRVVVGGDARNLPGASDPVAVEIEQTQAPAFTIVSSRPLAPAGSSVTISGVLDRPGAATPEPNALIQLWGRRAGQSRFVVLADGITAGDGSYRFTQRGLATDMTYFVRTMPMPHTGPRQTALVYQGVQDVVTMRPSSAEASAGQPVGFTGTARPEEAGHEVYLQELGRDGDWHTIEVGTIRADATFRFTWRSGPPGAFAFRARITGDRLQVGGRSGAVAVTVAASPPGASAPAS